MERNAFLESKTYHEYLKALDLSDSAWEAYQERLEKYRDLAETIADMYARHRAGKNISLAELHEYVDQYEQEKPKVQEYHDVWLDAAEAVREAWDRNEEEEAA